MTQFSIGDLVVYRDFYITELLKIDLIIDDKTVGYRGAKRRFMNFEGCSHTDELRLAEKDEIKLGHRVNQNMTSMSTYQNRREER
ncbi:hypothetical protein [Acinetobacter proteolyticus]|uniref:hypothetical protein n=1 Tax=Acinetobacter proteolyticus TaxID=1776741 RepID=UPI0031DFBC0C